MDDALIIFARTPEPGKVKTRLIDTLGEEGACRVYVQLLEHTINVCNALPADVWLFYEGDNPPQTVKQHSRIHVARQEGDDLGEKMKNAIRKLLGKRYRKIVLIGSDCPQLTPAVLESAFHALNEHDVVIGPARDGGYYLLGMKKLYPFLFHDKKWSSARVFRQTVADLRDYNLRYFKLPTLADLDRPEDLELLRHINLQS